MAEVMTESQLRQAKIFIRRLCANYDNGRCLLLDNLCPQCVSYTLLCKYFKEAVLPDRECLALQAEIWRGSYVRRCVMCGKPLQDRKKNSLFCVQCANLRLRQAKREWAQKNAWKNRKSKV